MKKQQTEPTLFDLIKLWTAEKYPNLVVQHWGGEGSFSGQIRISSAPIVPMQDSCIEYSLVSISGNAVYYHSDRTNWWNHYSYVLESPDFFEKLSEAIDIAIKNRKKYELQKSRAD